MKRLIIMLLFFLTSSLKAQEVELYWNAEDCAGKYNTDYVLQGYKTSLAVDYYDFIPDSVNFEVSGLADSLYSVDRYSCQFTPIDTTRFSITACLFHNGESFVLTKNYKVFPIPVFQVDLVPFYEDNELHHFKIRLTDSLTGLDITEDYLICVSYFDLKVRNKVLSSGFNHGYFIDVFNFENRIDREFKENEYFLLTGLKITPRECSQSIWLPTSIQMPLKSM